MLMSLFKWESKILNNIYKTQKYVHLQQLELSDPEQIDYNTFLQIEHKQGEHKNKQTFDNMQLVIESANLLCKQSTKSPILQSQVIKLNKIFQHNHNWIATTTKNQQFKQGSMIKQKQQQKQQTQKISYLNFRIEHVIIYSCLSKCKIWPKVLKSGRGFVPDLIDFYNTFTKQYNNYLDFKFDPIILSQKYTRIMKRVHTKKKDHPELINYLKKDDILKVICIALNDQTRQELLEEALSDSKGSDDIINKLESFLSTEQRKVIPEHLNSIVNNGKCVSHMIIQSCSLNSIKIYHWLGINFEATDDEKQTSIFFSVKRGDMKITQYLVEELKVDVNWREYQKRTAFYLAAFQGDIEAIKYLYKNGADPQLPSKLQRTPLSKACFLGNVQVVRYLLEIKADIQKRDVKGRTALHNAVWGIEGGRAGKRRGHIRLEDSPQCAQLLLNAGHPIQFSDFDGFTPLFSAVSSRANRSLKILLQRGANISHLTNKQQSCVFIAAKYGHLDTLKLLIEEHNSQFLQTDIHGYTPLCASITLPDPDVFNYLARLHVKHHQPLQLDKLLQCCLQYDRLDNWKYLLYFIEGGKKYVKRGSKQLEQQGTSKNVEIKNNSEQTLPWLKKNYQKYHLKDEQQQQQTIIEKNKFTIQAYKTILEQLQKLQYFVPLLNGLLTKSKISEQLGSFLEMSQPKHRQQQLVNSEEQQTEQKQLYDPKCDDSIKQKKKNINPNNQQKETNKYLKEEENSDEDQMIPTQINPLIRTNIKATVPTITTKLPSNRQISKQIVQFLIQIFNKILNSQNQQTSKLYTIIPDYLKQEDFNKIVHCLMKNYYSSGNSNIIDTVILIYNYCLDQDIPIVIDNFQISSMSCEQDILKVLYKCDSNLCSTKQQLLDTLMKLVRYRMTAPIITIYNDTLEQTQNKMKSQNKTKILRGINRYTKEQLLALLLHKNYKPSISRKQKKKGNQQKQEEDIMPIQSVENRLSLVQYCLVNGISDIYVYLKNVLISNGFDNFKFDEQFQKIGNKQGLQNADRIFHVRIPDYRLIRQNVYTIQQATVTLESVDQWVFDYHQVLQKLSEKQKYIYRSILANKNNTEQDQTESKFLSTNKYTLVCNHEQLQILRMKVAQNLIIGIDTEHYNNSKKQHFICSVQISIAGEIYILDPLSQAYIKKSKNIDEYGSDIISQKDIGKFIREIFDDQDKIKIFHAYQNDLRWLNQDYRVHLTSDLSLEINKIYNVVDTGRIYSCLQSSVKSKSNSIGLRTLAWKYLNYKMSKHFQQSDWRIRPLFEEMIQYAAIDAQILCFVFLEQLKTKIHQQSTESQDYIKKVNAGFTNMFFSKRTFRSGGSSYQIVPVEIESKNKSYQEMKNEEREQNQ